MPFESKAQMRKCFALKRQGKAQGWDCDEWAGATKDPKSLPEKKAGDIMNSEDMIKVASEEPGALFKEAGLKDTLKNIPTAIRKLLKDAKSGNLYHPSIKKGSVTRYLKDWERNSKSNEKEPFFARYLKGNEKISRYFK